MHRYTKHVLVTAISFALLLPVVSSAATTDNQARIKEIRTQIEALQKELKTLVGTSTPDGGGWKGEGGMPPGQVMKAACIILNRNLRQGTSGDDVKKLQESLAQDPDAGFTGTPTGFFGPATAKAMMRFQMKNGIASSTDGSVGPMTRGFFERRCGKGLGHDDQGKGPGDQRDDQTNAGLHPLASAITGVVTVANGGTITVQNREGNTHVVNVTSSTVVRVVTTQGHEPTTGSLTDIVVGKSVAVQGTRNADGLSLDAVQVIVGIPQPTSGSGDH